MGKVVNNRFCEGQAERQENQWAGTRESRFRDMNTDKFPYQFEASGSLVSLVRVGKWAQY